MGKISVFNFVSLDGYFKDKDSGVSWHSHDPNSEESRFSEESSSPANTLLFGRVTFEMMKSFWPTKIAYEMFPKTAEGMNEGEKIVFSRSLKVSDWKNTTFIGENIVDAVKKLKETKNITILGSGSIINQLTEAGLIDEYSFMIDPVVLGEGTSIFEGVKNKPKLRLKSSKTFKSGVILNIFEKV